jgi:hypothetical protein
VAPEEEVAARLSVIDSGASGHDAAALEGEFARCSRIKTMRWIDREQLRRAKGDAAREETQENESDG